MIDVKLKVSNIDKILEDLDSKHVKSYINHSIYVATNKVKDATLGNLHSKVKGSRSEKSPIWKTPLDKGIITKVNAQTSTGTVAITGDNRLRWYEKGTEERFYISGKHTKKGWYTKRQQRRMAENGHAVHRTGFIKTTHFFADAISSADITGIMIQEMDNQISKL